MKLSTTDLGPKPLPQPLVPARAVRALYKDQRSFLILAAIVAGAGLNKQVDDAFIDALEDHAITPEQIEEVQIDLGRIVILLSAFGVQLLQGDDALVKLTGTYGGQLALMELQKGLIESSADSIPKNLLSIRMIDALLGNIGTDVPGGPKTPSTFDHDDDEAM
jgi:hypothetical protein